MCLRGDVLSTKDLYGYKPVRVGQENHVGKFKVKFGENFR